MNTTIDYKVLNLKPNGAHGLSPLPRPYWIPPIPAAFMRAQRLAVCTPQYCTGHLYSNFILISETVNLYFCYR